MQRGACDLPGNLQREGGCQYNVKAGTLGPGGWEVQRKPKASCLLPHEVQTGGTCLLQDFRTVSIALCLRLNSAPSRERAGAGERGAQAPPSGTAHLALDFSGGACLP